MGAKCIGVRAMRDRDRSGEPVDRHVGTAVRKRLAAGLSKPAHEGVMRIEQQTRTSRQRSVEEAVALASQHLDRGDTQAALELLEKIAKCAPDLPAVRYLLGLAQLRQKSYDLAIFNLQKAVRADDHNINYLIALGEALSAQRPLEAIAHLARAVELGSDNPAAYTNLSGLLLSTHQAGDALRVCDLGAAACGPYPNLMWNRGIALESLSRYEESLGSLQLADALLPQDYRLIYNIGNVLRSMGRLAESRAYLDRAVALSPDSSIAHYNLGLSLLLAGEYHDGFRENEWRWGIPHFAEHRPDFPQPAWDGQELQGRRILLLSEQGAGDIIQFIRYAGFAQGRGGRVILSVPQPLVRLMHWLGNWEISAKEATPPDFDVFCPLQSLPHLAATELDSIPSPATFTVPSDIKRKWSELLGEKIGKRVGVVWAGSESHSNDRNRSLACRLFEPLLEIPQVEWFSLQVGPSTAQLAELGIQGRIRDLAPELTDYAETAAAISQLDLVITVDTSVAHLAGSLGTPVWMLTPFAPDWRWLLDRDDSPWYPSMRLFRQKAPGDWENVISSVAAALRQLVQVASAETSDSVAASLRSDVVSGKNPDRCAEVRPTNPIVAVPQVPQHYVLAFVGENANGILRWFTEKALAGFEKHGLAHKLIDLREPGAELQLLGALARGKPEFCFSWQGMGMDISLNNGENLWTNAGIPFVSCLGDNPYHMPQLHAAKGPRMHLLYGCLDSLQTYQHFLKGRTSASLVRLGHPENPMADRTPWHRRQNDIVYVKTGVDSKALRARWNHLQEIVRDILEDTATRVLSGVDESVATLCSKAFADRQISWEEQRPAFLSICSAVDFYARAVRAEQMVLGLMRHNALVVGDWSHLDQSGSQARFTGPIPASDLDELYANSKVVVNTLHTARFGVHERMLAGLFAKAAVVSDSTPFVQRTFQNCPSFFGLDIDKNTFGDELDQILEFCLTDPATSEKVQVSAAVAKDLFSFDDVIQQVVDLAAFDTAREMRPVNCTQTLLSNMG